MTYDESPAAHIQTEFGFDVLQVAQGHYASEAYHDFIGSKYRSPCSNARLKKRTVLKWQGFLPAWIWPLVRTVTA